MVALQKSKMRSSQIGTCTSHWLVPGTRTARKPADNVLINVPRMCRAPQSSSGLTTQTFIPNPDSFVDSTMRATVTDHLTGTATSASGAHRDVAANVAGTAATTTGSIARNTATSNVTGTQTTAASSNTSSVDRDASATVGWRRQAGLTRSHAALSGDRPSSASDASVARVLPLTFTLTMKACLSRAAEDVPTFEQLLTLVDDMLDEVQQEEYVDSDGHLRVCHLLLARRERAQLLINSKLQVGAFCASGSTCMW